MYLLFLILYFDNMVIKLSYFISLTIIAYISSKRFTKYLKSTINLLRFKTKKSTLNE